MAGVYITKADLRGLEGEDLAARLRQAGLSESLITSITDKFITGRLLSIMEVTDVLEEFKEDPIEHRIHLRAFLRELNAATDSDETQDQGSTEISLQNKQSKDLTSIQSKSTVTDTLVISKQNKESTDLSNTQSKSTATDQEAVVPDDEDKLYKEFKFPIPQSVKRKLEYSQKVDEPEKKKIVRESLACLEALVGEEPTKNQIQIAAKKICDTIPQLKDPKPPSFPDKIEFPYWGTVRFMMSKRRINAKAYLNRGDTKPKTLKKPGPVELSDKEYENMTTELLKESKKKRQNTKAILEMQQLTFSRRNDNIITKEMDVNSIKSDFPFLMKDLLIRNELYLHISKQQKDKSYSCPTVEDFEKNWEEVVKRSLNKDPDLCGEELSGHTLENINVNFPKCEPIMYFVENNTTLDILELSKQVKLKDWPWLLCFQEDADTFRQLFVVLDNKIFLEIESDTSENAPFAKAVVTLLGIYYVFNLEYKESQKLLYTFLEEFVLGVKPSRQTLRYRKAVQATVE